MIAMLKLLPVWLKKRIPAPMLGKNRLQAGRTHPTIAMNLANLLICADYCGRCPSSPGIAGEALYCASGKSRAKIEEKGCKCLSCPLFEQCSAANSAYFCIYGSCPPRDERSAAIKLSDLSRAYLQQFVLTDEDEVAPDEKSVQEVSAVEAHPVRMEFLGDQVVHTQSNVPVLQASLQAGIPHTHVCGGQARCSTCRVLVTSGLEHCRPRNDKESRLARIKGFPAEVRLACQTTVTGDVTLRRLVLDAEDISEAISQGRATIGEIGREVQATILFSDIRSFTTFSEKALPYDIIHILNRYFESIGRIIDHNGGYIDKYLGDGIMAIFGLRRDMQQNHALMAVAAALEMQSAVEEFNTYLEAHFNHRFRIGIGIHSGMVIVGNLGFSLKKEYTAIGDTVNTAARIEALNKNTQTTILVSESTYRQVADAFHWGKKFQARVKGREEQVRVFEVLSRREYNGHPARSPAD